jgi:electron transport complex protein RnfG
VNDVARGGLTLAAIAAVCAGLVATTWHLTRDRIGANQQALLEQSLEPALAGLFFDGKLSESRLVIAPPHDLPGPDPVIVYRVYRQGQPVAALIAVTARDGYAGPIRILVGIGYEGGVTGVRILEHRETPGLGDQIDEDRSDWVGQFNGRSLADPELPGWRLKRDGGEFDQLSGASVTPRAVLKAIRETLVWYEAHRDDVFATDEDDSP